MTATSTTQLLPAEIALAARVVNERLVPSDLLAWLRSPRRVGKCGHEAGLIAIAIEEIVGTLARDADDWLAKELKHASAWYGYAIQSYVARESTDIAKRQILTALLPLYRCLATGELSLSFAISRHRLAEIHFIAATQKVLGGPLTELLEAAEQTRQCPDSTIAGHLDLGIGPAAGVAMDLCARDQNSPQSGDSLDWIAEQRVADFEHDVASWAEPALLWRLAGEVLDRNPNKVLPRSWVDIPVPWPSVTDHWRRIESEIDRLLATTAPEQITSPEQTELPTSVVSERARASETPRGQNLPAKPKRSPSGESISSESALDQLTEVLDAEIAHEAAASVANDADVAGPKEAVVVTPVSTEPATPVSGPCYSTAEIHNHNDPVFCSALNRTLAQARKEQRSLSLATIVILPDGEAHVDYFDVGANGIQRWQSRLIDNLSSHPEMPETACYVTGEGEVIMTVLDLDRGLATEIIRESILETLSCSTADGSSLVKVDVQAKFHVGIATTSRPGPNMTPEALIGPSRRCFTAAAMQGGASIKSIEVY